jgi:VWFA-related protein
MKISVRAAIVALSALAWAAAPAGKSGSDKPKDIGLVEKASTHLAQVDVTVTGKPEVIASLRPEDFVLSVMRQRVPEVIVDRVCQPTAPEAQAPGEEPAPVAPPTGGGKTIAVRSQPATYLFYFDQPHLTMAGRQRALDLAREIARKVIVGESRGIVVSSAKDLATVIPLTSDPAKLLEALTRLENDRTQWSPYATLEDKRVSEVLEILDEPMGGVHQAMGRARFYQAEESWEMQKALNRLSMVMGTLEDVDPPKAVFYFADTMRAKPGNHYLALFSESVQRDDPGSRILDTDARFGSLTMDRIINEASAHGIRFYPIEAQGLVSLSSTESIGFRASYYTNNAAIPSTVRTHEAQDTLSAMALETGGQAFLNGVAGGKIASRVLADLSCVFLVSFDPGEYPLDQPLPVRVQIKKPGVSVQARGRLVIQSDSSRLTSRLLAAFSTPQAARSDVPVEIRTIPTGWRDGAFSALVQLYVPASKYPGATWDLGASLVSQDQVREDTSARLEVAAAGVPLVLEREMRFAPGGYEIVAVAHESSTDQIASRQVDGSWPDLRDVPAAVAPVALLQPMVGLFRRNGANQGHGSRAHGEEEPVSPDLPAAFVTLACRGKDQKGPLRAERRLYGESQVSFSPQDLDLEKDLCAQIRDVVPAKVMGPGEFRYEVRILVGDRELARADRKFRVLAPPAPSGAGASPLPSPTGR